MGIVTTRHCELLLGDVPPHLQFLPVADWESPDVFSRIYPGVVEIPELGTLVFRVPLTKLVAKGKNPLFRSGLFLVPARAADAGVKAKLLDGIQQSDRLVNIAALIGRFEDHFSLLDRVFHRAYDKTLA